ncbi:hypothetical protein PIB30_076708 [Stylosanthes scabra]|uniref:Glycosyltransferase n=1 Tax=Stylosanthes scabra TaxID=79078 RepID=A0ABU6QQW8_9FABA|nr:hypothetical protein [Stylosanthes scabra]
MPNREMKKPHAVMVPFPSQGHINPFLKLAKILHTKGFHITFVNTEFNHMRLLKSRGSNALNGIPSFKFETIPDGLPPPSNMDATQSTPALCDSTSKHCLIPFSNLISKLNAASDSPPVSCIISDGAMAFTVKASQQFGLPIVLFWTHSACAFMTYTQCKNLMQRGLTPLKDAKYLRNGHLETIIDWIPGMKNIALRDLPGIYHTTDPNDKLLDFVVEQMEAASRASAILLPTFDALETDVLIALSTMFPKLYTIGPMELLLDHHQTSESKFESINCNLWKEESECLKWLDSQEHNSVLPDLVEGEASIVPQDFVSETKERGLMVSWCPQEQVLKHHAVAGFLTHCGWNSTLESITNGVPLLCCPFFNDQTLNCKYACDEWGFGMKMNSDDVKGDQVEKLVKELLEGQKGKQLKTTAMKWKKLAQEAANTDGSSFLNLDKMVNEVLLATNRN